MEHKRSTDAIVMRAASVLLLSYASGFEQTAGIEFLRMVQDLLHGSLLDAYSLMHNEECVTKPLRER